MATLDDGQHAAASRSRLVTNFSDDSTMHLGLLILTYTQMGMDQYL